MPRQHNLARVYPPQRPARAKDLIERAEGLPARPGEKLDGRLLDEIVFRIPTGHGSDQPLSGFHVCATALSSFGDAFGGIFEVFPSFFTSFHPLH
jgi:hypothetical protein